MFMSSAAGVPLWGPEVGISNNDDAQALRGPAAPQRSALMVVTSLSRRPFRPGLGLQPKGSAPVVMGCFLRQCVAGTAAKASQAGANFSRTAFQGFLLRGLHSALPRGVTFMDVSLADPGTHSLGAAAQLGRDPLHGAAVGVPVNLTGRMLRGTLS